MQVDLEGMRSREIQTYTLYNWTANSPNNKKDEKNKEETHFLSDHIYLMIIFCWQLTFFFINILLLLYFLCLLYQLLLSDFFLVYSNDCLVQSKKKKYDCKINWLKNVITQYFVVNSVFFFFCILFNFCPNTPAFNNQMSHAVTLLEPL